MKYSDLHTRTTFSDGKHTVEEMVRWTQCGQPDILGRFDVVGKYGFVDESSPIYRSMATETLIACLEVNAHCGDEHRACDPQVEKQCLSGHIDYLKNK